MLVLMPLRGALVRKTSVYSKSLSAALARAGCTMYSRRLYRRLVRVVFVVPTRWTLSLKVNRGAVTSTVIQYTLQR